MTSVLIIAGESSGERYGAGLIREFKKIRNDCRFFGIGGQTMQTAGVELIYPMEDLAVNGIFEVVSHLPRLRRMFQRLKNEAHSRRPDCAVLIDSPDFNLRLAKVLKKLSIPVLYYVSPTIWAWRKNRIRLIRRLVDKMLLIFPFEEQIYENHGISARYIGHPLIERITTSLSPEQFRKKYKIDHGKKIIALLPGSRKSELSYHLPVLVQAMRLLNDHYDLQYVLLLSENIEKTYITKYLASDLNNNTSILTSDGYDAMAASDLVLSSCGTANLEAALLRTPVIAYYRLSSLSYAVGINLLRIKNYSIVNILAGRKVIPELIQKKFTAENILHETEKILNSETVKEEMLNQFENLNKILGTGFASRNAAQELENLLNKREES